MAATLPRSTTIARVALAALALLGVTETARSVQARAPRLTDAVWRAVEDAHDPSVPLVLETEWLGPEARMQLAAAAAPDVVGRPDLRGHQAFEVLRTVSSAASGSRRWQAELGPAQRVSLERQRSLGPLVLERWIVENPSRVVDALHRGALAVSAGGDAHRACRGGVAQGMTCRLEDGRSLEIQRRFGEVDYGPRRCLSIPVDDAFHVTLLRPDFKRGDTLVGHLGFEDFNARLRNAGPVTLELRLDGALVGRRTFTPSQGWAPFELPTTPGSGRLSVTLRATSGGRWTSPPPTWQENAERRVCLELRALEGAAP